MELQQSLDRVWVVARPLALIGIALLALAVLAGCQWGELPEREQQPAPLPEGGQAVRMLVVQGPEGSTLALVPVYIDGQGPFAFALDTGASHSVIDRQIAEKLRLPVAGQPVVTTGVASQSTAIPVSVEQWAVGELELPAGRLVALDLADSDRQFRLQGLLGSDVLSRFGSVQIDYDGQWLTFRDDVATTTARTPRPASVAVGR